MSQSVEIIDVSEITHNVRQFKVEKPDGYEFAPGQATEVAIDRDGWRDQRRPFTFTSLTSAPELEFVIKIYPDHDGVTEQLNSLAAGDRLLIGDAWGAIKYQGPGYFIAGGAGVTPFIAIIRDLQAMEALEGNTLIFSNKMEEDIILRSEFESANGLVNVFTVTDQPSSPLHRGKIDKAFLQKHVTDFGKEFYVCGPPPMVEDVSQALEDLGAQSNNIIFEE
jgi:ferredoxin-NADP reductase